MPFLFRISDSHCHFVGSILSVLHEHRRDVYNPVFNYTILPRNPVSRYPIEPLESNSSITGGQLHETVIASPAETVAKAGHGNPGFLRVPHPITEQLPLEFTYF